jgi:hypothetical protein
MSYSRYLNDVLPMFATRIFMALTAQSRKPS